MPITGLRMCKTLGLIKKMDTIEVLESKNTEKDIYDVFQGIGKLSTGCIYTRCYIAIATSYGDKHCYDNIEWAGTKHDANTIVQ